MTMLLGLHTYSLYLHGIGQAWADFKLPWPRQLTTFELFDEAVRMGLDGLHLDDGVLESLDTAYLEGSKRRGRRTRPLPGIQFFHGPGRHGHRDSA